MPRRAFPNAYLSTDELPKRSIIRSALCLAAMVGVGYLGLVIFLLSLSSMEYSPITQFASDYGVGPFAIEMNSGFFLAGMGFMSLAVAVYAGGTGRAEKAGGALLVPAGLALVVSALYATDIEGTAQTFHGTVHGVGGLVFFVVAPASLLLITYGSARKWFGPALMAYAQGFAFLVANAFLGLNETGLVERDIILVVFASAILASVMKYRQG